MIVLLAACRLPFSKHMGDSKNWEPLGWIPIYLYLDLCLSSFLFMYISISIYGCAPAPPSSPSPRGVEVIVLT